jgi:ribosomal protein S12 methylthiotransferase accessory factor
VKLTSQMKYGNDGIPRVVRAEETIKRIKPYMKGIGVTRVADTTGLDTLGLPVFSAIRPTDAGFDGISVYNGKGLTKAASHAGAMMEAIERYCVESWYHNRKVGTRAQVEKSNPQLFVMDPDTMILQQEGRYDADTVLEWGEGWDLLNDRPALIPLAMIMTPYRGAGQGIWYSSSNGLASGNNLEEAVCHALAELIERDAYTIAAIRAELVPRVQAFLDSVTMGAPPEAAQVDRSHTPSILLDTVPAPVRRLVRAAQRDKSEIWLRDMTSDLGIPAFVASMRRMEDDGTELAAGGFGCDPNSTIAAIRAITETAQGRNVQIQGVREDASAARAMPDAASTRRALWCHDSDRWITFQDVPSYENQDILSDIELMLDRLRAAGIHEAYAVDVSDPALPASVIKMIIPEMECWFLRDFAADNSRLGWRAQRYLPIA